MKYYYKRPAFDFYDTVAMECWLSDMAKKKAANNPVIRSYTNAYQRITADKQRGNISVEDWQKAKREIIDLRDMAVSGLLSDRDVDAQMQSAVLYPSLGITKKGGR